MENELNLPPFYVGQKVVVDSSGITREYEIKHRGLINKGDVYVVSGNVFDTKWNLWYTYLKGISFALASEFLKPIQEQKFPLITLSKIQELEKEEILINN